MKEYDIKLHYNFNNNYMCNYIPMVFFRETFFQKADEINILTKKNDIFVLVDKFIIYKLYRNVQYKYISIFKNIITGYDDLDADLIIKDLNGNEITTDETPCTFIILKRKSWTPPLGLSYLAELKSETK